MNAAITNEFMEENVAALLTAERLERLRAEVRVLDPVAREAKVLKALEEQVTVQGSRYWQHFRFGSDDADKTSHYIVLVTKSPAGIAPMKDIMAQVSPESVDGVATLEYAPKASRQMELLDKRPLEQLADDLRTRFSGRSLTAIEVFQEHHAGTRYRRTNYKNALLAMEAAGRVACTPSAAERLHRDGRPTLADDVQVVFPALAEKQDTLNT